MELNLDAWSDGQVRSKLWLCEEFERHFENTKPLHVWIYGSWYGTLAQFLLIRGRVPIRRIQLFDLDESVIDISRKMLNHWICNRHVELDFHVGDCSTVVPSADEDGPDVLINTSCEHFENASWFKKLPAGMKYIVQSTNMNHREHIFKAESVDHFKSQLVLERDPLYAGKLSFKYPGFSFDRYMLIGRK